MIISINQQSVGLFVWQLKSWIETYIPLELQCGCAVKMLEADSIAACVTRTCEKMNLKTK